VDKTRPPAATSVVKNMLSFVSSRLSSPRVSHDSVKYEVDKVMTAATGFITRMVENGVDISTKQETGFSYRVQDPENHFPKTVDEVTDYITDKLHGTSMQLNFTPTKEHNSDLSVEGTKRSEEMQTYARFLSVEES